MTYVALRADFERIYPPKIKTSLLHRGRIWRLANPRFLTVVLIRLSKFFSDTPLVRLIAPIFTWLNFFIFGIEVTTRCKIGDGLLVAHPAGIVIGATSIGRNVTIFSGVTMGAKEADLGFEISLRPQIGNNVVIGSGAKIIGGVKIGDFAIIGANAVVVADVPPQATVVGIPAKIIRGYEEA